MPSLRVATFNVLFGGPGDDPGSWSARLPLLSRAIERARPDLLGLQEVLPTMLDSVAGALGGRALLPGPCSGPARWFDVSHPLGLALEAIRTRRWPRRDPSGARALEGGEQLPIAWRPDRLRPLESGAFWISPEPDRPGSMPRLAPAPAFVHWARFERLDAPRTILMLNAHLGHAPWRHVLAASILGTRTARLEAAAPPGPGWTFLVGDFNAPPSSVLLRVLTSASGGGFMDAVRSAAERVGPPVTYHWGVGARRLGLTIDYVLARHAPRPRRAEIVDLHEGGLFPSDHHPVVVEVEDGAAP